MTNRSTTWAQHGMRLKEKAERTTGLRSGRYAWAAVHCFAMAIKFQKEEQKALSGEVTSRQGLALG